MVRQDPPVIEGTPYVVPTLRLRIVDAQSGKPVADREVWVQYVWHWFEYPHEGFVFGVWSDVRIPRKCATDLEGFVDVPQFRVTPRGWYKGKLLLWHKPEFTHLEIKTTRSTGTGAVQTDSFEIDRKDLNRYQDEKRQSLTLRISQSF